MKTIQLLMVLMLGLVMAPAQEATTADKVSNLEIEQIMRSVKLSDWAVICKKSGFLSTKPKVTSVDKYGGVHASGAPPIMRDWTDVYGAPASRSYSQGWSAEKKDAEALLKRPMRDDQRRWLVAFVEACEALTAKDAKTFQERVTALAEDFRTLL